MVPEKLTLITVLDPACQRRLITPNCDIVCRMAQPRRLPDTISDSRVVIRLTAEEREKLITAADAAGVTVSEFVRGTAIKKAARVIRANSAGAAIP